MAINPPSDSSCIRPCCAVAIVAITVVIPITKKIIANINVIERATMGQLIATCK
jgi:hypothetical protein